jgi:hypothetical protein
VANGLGCPNLAELHKILPSFGENRTGWYLWELMIGVDQTRHQWPNSPPVVDEVVFQGLLSDAVRLTRASAQLDTRV